MESKGTEQSLCVSDGGHSDHGEVGGGRLLLSVQMDAVRVWRCGT